MDWQSSMGLYQYQQPQEEEMQEEGDDEPDNFYDEEDAKAGAEDGDGDGDDGEDLLSSLLPKEHVKTGVKVPELQTPKHATVPSAEEKRAENRQKAELLKAQLMAKRQNTPLKSGTPQPRMATPAPSKTNVTPLQIAKTPAPAQPTPRPEDDVFRFNANAPLETPKPAQPKDDSIDIDSMIADAKRTAEAKRSQQSTPAPAPAPVNGLNNVAEMKKPSPASTNNVKPAAPVPPTETPVPAQQQQHAPVQVHQTPIAPTNLADVSKTNDTVNNTTRPQQLNDAYYADLAVWLEFTGYHDVEYRTAKLAKHKARRALEAEAAKIQQQLDRLKCEEEAEMAALRGNVAHTSAAPASAPALPVALPSGETSDVARLKEVGDRVMTNGSGIKRPHSPIPIERSSRRREELPSLAATNGFRIRGANDSPTSPRDGIERRISYPDPLPRRRGSDETSRDLDSRVQSRDPSLERRQNYYRRDGAPPRALHDTYEPRDRDFRADPPRPKEFYANSTWTNRNGGSGYRGRGGRNYSESYRGGGGGGGRAPARDLMR